MPGTTLSGVRGTGARWLTWAVVLLAAVAPWPAVRGSDTPVPEQPSGVHGVQRYRLPDGAPKVTWWSEDDEHALHGGQWRARVGSPEPMRRHSLGKW